MEFSPANPIVKLCLQGMHCEEQGQTPEALALFQQAWEQATNDSEKFLAAHYLARNQANQHDRLTWLETALNLALGINDDSVNSALPALYEKLANAYEAQNNSEKAAEYHRLSQIAAASPSDKGPFYHGTKADLQTGDFLNPGHTSNYNEALTMNHIYFTAIPNGAGLAAALAKGTGKERVYVVKPTGSFENDPNVTDKKFPGNPTRSYRTDKPLKIVGELTDWVRQTPEELQKWRERLAKPQGDIIN